MCNTFGFSLYVFLNKIFLPQITDLGRTNTLSTEIVVATPTSPTVLRIDFPAPSRKKRSSSGYTYGRGFLISLSYDEIHFSESMTVIIYNDACYSCSASTLTCNITVRKTGICFGDCMYYYAMLEMNVMYMFYCSLKLSFFHCDVSVNVNDKPLKYFI